MGGLQKGDYIVLAGESSHGKTSIAMSMLFNSAVTYNEPCGIISHEMTPEKIMARFAGMATGISSKHILTGKLNDSEIEQFNFNVSKLIKSNIFIQDFIKNTLTETVSAIRLMVMQHHVKYVVVENAGNITVKGVQEDERRTAEISKTLASIAKELGITVILISHLNRDRDKKRQPDLSRLRHSGQLEFDADVVLFIYMPELHGYATFSEALNGDPGFSTENMAKVYIAKGRNYGLAESFCRFMPYTTYVSDYIEQQESIQPNVSFDKVPF
jgi:replicative DNA helicase